MMKRPRINIQCRTIYSSVRLLQMKPSELYGQRVTDGQLIDDSHQRRIVKQLDSVHESLVDYSPPSQSAISKLFGRMKEPPNGLYMHGSVGCGKTMLMDLFFSCCKVNIFYTLLLLLSRRDIAKYIRKLYLHLYCKNQN